MKDTLLQIEDLVIGHNKTPLCSPINMEAQQGELIGVIGRNGTGKSTLLHTLSAYTPSLRGTASLMGTPMHAAGQKQKAKLLSMVSTASNQQCGLSVLEILSTAFYMETNWKNALSEEQKKLLHATSALFDIAHLHHKKSFEISDGERQRVMIATAYARNTPLLLLDEPTAYLDIPNKIKVFELLKDIAQRGKLVIFTTHDIHFAWNNMDRCWLFNSQSKSLEELSLQENLSNFNREDFNKFIINKLQ